MDNARKFYQVLGGGMDNEEIKEFIAGREEDIAGWEQENIDDLLMLKRLPLLIADRQRWIAASRARIAAMTERMESQKWNEVSM